MRITSEWGFETEIGIVDEGRGFESSWERFCENGGRKESMDQVGVGYFIPKVVSLNL